MKKTIPISEFKESADIQGFYLCKKKNLRTTRAGELYLDLLLQDKSGEIGAKVWDRVSEFTKKFNGGDAVAVRGRVESFQDRLQIVIGRINSATEAKYGRYGFKEELLVPTSPYDAEKMWSSIGKMIKNMSNQPLKKLVTDLYRRNKASLMKLPASLNMHYPYRSGYLEHILSMAKNGLKLAPHYNADTDLLLAGILLHGIGKVPELGDELVPDYSDEGHFIGHTVLGRDMVRESAASIKDFPSDILSELEHMILCHEGAFESRFRSRPRTKEALLLQLLDNFDAKVAMFDRILREDSEEGDWTSRRNYFGTHLRKKPTDDDD